MAEPDEALMMKTPDPQGYNSGYADPAISSLDDHTGSGSDHLVKLLDIVSVHTKTAA